MTRLAVPLSLATCHLSLARRNRRAFSLVELLIAIGIILALLAAFGAALTGRGSEGAALLSAQNTIQSLVGSTRAQAALHQTTARLLVYAAPPPAGDADKYLHYLQVVREEPFGSGTWTASGPAVTLPAGIFIVPPANVQTTGGIAWNTNTISGPISLFVSRTAIAMTVDQQPFGGTTGRLAYYIEFTSDGRPTPSFVGATSPPKLAVATATPSITAAPAFNNTSAVRGLLLRASGAITRVNDANSF
jgi:prepilin-type N-terminal cleavage/methylation domain-containing protein